MSTEITRKFEIPATISEAVDTANVLGELAIAATWKRSAIVRAFCEHGKPGPKVDRTKSSAISIREFSRLGIVGLKSQDTVRRYYDAWELTGLPDPAPGEITELPSVDLDFPAVAAPSQNTSLGSFDGPSDEPPWDGPSENTGIATWDDSEVVDGEIVDDVPSMTPAEAGELVRQAEQVGSPYEHAWDHYRRAQSALLDIRNDQRNGIFPTGPVSEATIASVRGLVIEIFPELAR